VCVPYQLLFPKPSPPTYAFDSWPDATIWIPNSVSKAEVPCLFFQADKADLLMIFSHGNGCDMGGMADTMHQYKLLFKAHVLIWCCRLAFARLIADVVSISGSTQDVHDDLLRLLSVLLLILESLLADQTGLRRAVRTRLRSTPTCTRYAASTQRRP
jgi:hypothetical protein